ALDRHLPLFSRSPLPSSGPLVRCPSFGSSQSILRPCPRQTSPPCVPQDLSQDLSNCSPWLPPRCVAFPLSVALPFPALRGSFAICGYV
ncbi:hypothetical protein DFH09DRAFT_1370077, partial [Mycena vulgaris]